jgi:UDP-N-acetylmuramate dehydrogenase
MEATVKQKIQELAKGVVKCDEPMAEHTTIRVGGPAAIYFEPRDIDDLTTVIKGIDLKETPLFYLGAGSNVLFRDKGFDGIVIHFGSLLDDFKIESEEGDTVVLYAGCGASLSKLVQFTAEHSLTGFEILTGVPGTIGGALSMNAGVREGEISGVVRSVKILTKGKIIEQPKAKLEFSYRKLHLPRADIILSGLFELKKGNPVEIEKRIADIREKRAATQPLKWPSFGSTFKNPPKGAPAGRLIEEAGLKNIRVGGARVSEVHANWIVNEGKATARDVEVLMRLIREKVKESSGIALEPEVVVVGKE